MSIILKCFLAFILSFVFGMIIAPFVIKIMSRLKAQQTILQYVDQHAQKNGTPTMGGFIFILPVVMVSLIFSWNYMTIIAVLTILAYCLIGFLDDYIKVKTKNNLGLKPYQKVIGQLGIAIILAVYVYKNPNISSYVNIPFLKDEVNLNWFSIPFTIFIYIATTNAVNLTDGLDGLAGSVGVVYFMSFALILLLGYSEGEENIGLIIMSSAFVGALLAYLWFNFNPSKIMMGDTGSLALGGGVATVAVFSKNPLIIPISGIMFVVSCISVIVQVIVYKTRGKRVFLMAPYHHHLEKKGIAEWNIVMRYVVISIIFSSISIISGGLYEL